MKLLIASCAAALAIAFTGAADAQPVAFTAKQVHLRAGPGRSYPIVAVLPPQMQVSVFGCIDAYTWCDVATGYERGWVYAGNLLYYQDNRSQALSLVAPVIGIAITSFIIDDYWHEHYVDRWWWPQRRRWYYPPPRPPVHGGPPVYAPHPAPGGYPPGRPAPRPHPAPHVKPHPQVHQAPNILRAPHDQMQRQAPHPPPRDRGRRNP